MGLGPGLLLIWTLVSQCGLGIGSWEAVSSAEAQALLKPVGSELWSGAQEPVLTPPPVIRMGPCLNAS